VLLGPGLLTIPFEQKLSTIDSIHTEEGGWVLSLSAGDISTPGLTAVYEFAGIRSSSGFGRL